MKFRIRFAYQIVGVFVIVGMLSFIAILVTVGANQRWFARNYYYRSLFSSASGLSIGMPITFKGFQIGRLEKMELTAENDVEIIFHVQDRYIDTVRENSVIQLISNPLGLGGGLVFHQGRYPSAPPEEYSVIPSLDSVEARQLIADDLVVLPRQEDQITRLLDQIDPILENVTTLTATLDIAVAEATQTLQIVNATLNGSSRDGPIAELFIGVDAIIDELERTIRNTVTQADGILVYIEEIAKNVALASDAIADPTGIVPRLLDPSGSIAKILDDDEVLFDRIDGLLSDLSDVTMELADLTQFMNRTTPQLTGILEEGRRTLATGKDVLEGLSNNPLIRGGISTQLEPPATFGGFRDPEF